MTGHLGSRQVRGALVVTLGLWLAVTPAVGHGAQSPAADPLPSAAAAVGQPSKSPVIAAPPAELVLGNRYICELRSTQYGVSPAQRVEAIRARGRDIVLEGGPLEISTRAIDDGVLLEVDGKPLFIVFDDDVRQELGETPESVAQSAAATLRIVIKEMLEARDPRALLPAIGWALAATMLLFLSLWVLRRMHRWVSGRFAALSLQRLGRWMPAWSHSVVGENELTGLVRIPATLIAAGVTLVLVYEWLAFVLRQFPYTRPWGEALFENMFNVIIKVGAALLAAAPGLLFVMVIFIVARMTTRLTSRFFAQVQSGRVELGWLDGTTARPTGKVLNALIWLFALVAAYPYIPGSGSEAFKGIGVFLGLMLSIGSSGIVNQAISGLMLMYTRSLRPGEFVQVGETEGVVTSIGFLTTRIETLQREEVSLPNALIAGNMTRNYSRLADSGGLLVSTKVSIGYDVPWRQVEAMLLLAARRTAGIDPEPPARVLQTALLDFYVEYMLLVALHDASRRVQLRNDLLANIQDVFNEYGVQIASPHYEADPGQPKVVPKEDWYKAPARPPPGAGSDVSDQP